VQVRDRGAIDEAREEVDAMLARRGDEFARPLQRALRDLMSEHCGVVRSESSLLEGLRALGDIRERTCALEVRPDIAGYADLAHAFDLHGSLLAARATLECALERRETRGAHNRLDFPAQDPALRVNLVWTTDGPIAHEPIAAPSARVAALTGGEENDIAGRLLE
jgi:succinate dehydrogenase / fumarate reductase, flavoprotein subunit